MSGNAPTMHDALKFAIRPADVVAGTGVMRPFRPSTLLQRLTLAGAGLAIAATLFAFAGGLVAFGLWPDELSPDGSQRLVLRAPAAERAAAERPRRVAVAVRGVSVSRPRPAPPALADPVITPPAALLARPTEPSPLRPVPQVPAPAEVEPQPLLPAAPTSPALPVGDVVVGTTSALEQTLGDVVTALEQGLAAVGDLLDGPGR